MDGDPIISYIDSLIIDVNNDEFSLDRESEAASMVPAVSITTISNKVFIVHGHDELTKTEVARYLEKLGLEAIILHEQASRGMTIIEKIEKYTDVGFAIILYSQDDKGNAKEHAAKGDLNNRGRQNVVFEHGFLIAKLGRHRVAALVNDRIELPSDISGIVYIGDKSWQMDIAKEMRSAGLSIDLNKLA